MTFLFCFNLLFINFKSDLGSYGTGIIEKGEGGLNYWAQNHKFDFIIHNGDLVFLYNF